MYRRLAFCVLLGLFIVFGLFSLQTVYGQDKIKGAKGDKSEKVKRKPLVVMKQAEIEGKVFILTPEDETSKGAENIFLEVRTFADDISVYKTKAEKDGSYVLPNLEIGKYRFTVGYLKLELVVENPDLLKNRDKKVSKKIIVFLPESLVKTVEK